MPKKNVRGTIVKFATGGGEKYLAIELTDTNENEYVGVVHAEGLTDTETVHDMVAEMRARGTVESTSKNKVVHIPLSLFDPKNPDRVWTDEEYIKAFAIVAKIHGLEGQPFFIVRHQKQSMTEPRERDHAHAVFYNIRDGKPIPHSFWKIKNEEASIAVSKHFGLPLGHGKFVNKDPNAKVKSKGPKLSEWQRRQEFRTGVKTATVAAIVTDAFRKHKWEPEAFIAAIERHGTVARGDKVPLMFVDNAGGYHPLHKLINGEDFTADDLAKHLAIDTRALPTLEEAKAGCTKDGGERLRQASAMHKEQMKAKTKKAKAERKAAANDNAGRTREAPKTEPKRPRVDPALFAAFCLETYKTSRNAADFDAQLRIAGCCLARGDKYGWGIVDPYGNFHSPRRAFRTDDGAKGGHDDVDRLLAIDPATLPSLDEARKLVNPAQAYLFLKAKPAKATAESDDTATVERPAKKTPVERDPYIVPVRKSTYVDRDLMALREFGMNYDELDAKQKAHVRHQALVKKMQDAALAQLAEANLARMSAELRQAPPQAERDDQPVI